ncbi:hypothetical protein ONS95_000377 [Cadophora gregata]|uniref:uncharacterized protein n=1 Tax=Cadophora gregata TaxID=51156 RepID=UPI0026DA8FEE|nr:uncharacterized protein ONS95_000377 [Cadophora gregata]KAK0128404.1 hypothetical protein ONS95_000377 [Cadophora gregata]
MSLNGLDDLKIKESHDAAVAEPGGWFLLKYASRDEVELAGRGNGGIVEIRNAIAQFEEPSPLFGFLRYRRRNVVIKYVPEECSRLVQARVSVHFNAVTERFSPHDTVFPITTAKELRDTTLSAACSLHTASGSTSSSTSSLRRRRLMEIAEDAEEETRAKRQSTVPEERPPTAKTATSLSGTQAPLPESSLLPDLPSGLPPSASFNSMVSEAGSYVSPVKDSQGHDTRPYSPTERRKSSQSMRPDLYTLSSYGSNGRPKVKLGPRPSLDVGGRPHTSGAASYYRPVSTLPAGLKLFSKGSKKDKDRNKSEHPTEPPTMTISPPVPDSMLSPTQNIQTRPHTSGGRPNIGSESLTSPTLTSPNSSTGPRQPIITPEKARLMKAMQLRNKKKMEAVKPTEPVSQEHSESLASPIRTDETMSNGAPKDVDDTLNTMDMLAKADDSGIAFDANSTLRTDESDATRSDSYPVSPIGPSEKAESTRASSISESTDETVHNSLKQPILEEPHVETELEEVTSDSEDTTPIAKSSTISTSLEPAEEKLEQLSPTVYNPLQAWTETPEVVAPRVEEKEVVEEQSTPVAQQIQETPESAIQHSESIVPALSTPGIEVSSPVTSPKEATHGQDQSAVADSVPQDVEPLSPSRKMKIPTSRFNVQEPEEETDVASRELPAPVLDAEITASEKSPVGSTFSTGDESQDVQNSKRQRRKGLVEPIRTDLEIVGRSRANSDVNFSSDDDLMEELSSAVVQEAQPISVSKSPVSPVFPSPKKKQGESSRFSRVFSTPLRKEKSDTLELPSADRPPSRSVSAGAAYLNRISQQPSKPLAKKVNLGSGISQRIKALEKLQSLAPGATATGTTGPPPGSSPAFFSVRKASVRGKSPSIAERANSLTRNSPSNSPDSSPETFKPRERSGSVRSRLDVFTSGGVPTTLPARSRPESISVTARIIRDPSQPFPSKSELGKDPSEYAPLDLKQSPLVIDHQRAVVQPPKETIQERRLSKERRLSTSSKATTTKERRSSITIIKDLISDRRSSFSERRQSVTIETATSPSGRSSSRPPSVHASPAHQRPMSISSRPSTSSRDPAQSLSPPPTAGSTSSTGDEKAEKKSNRASRMMRRMSSGISASRKTIAHAISPTVREESEPLHNNDAQSMTSSYPSNNSMAPSSVDIGDVNVQFPDSLLWKRRSMLLDSQGFLIISPALSAHGNGRDKANAGATRRFHLSEFRTPSIPDVEMQELPNSVVLDFIEGGGLQLACEDRAGQGRILSSKYSIWSSSSFY